MLSLKLVSSLRVFDRYFYVTVCLCMHACRLSLSNIATIIKCDNYIGVNFLYVYAKKNVLFPVFTVL